MASVSHTSEYQVLRHAMGRGIIRLGELSGKELDELLQEILSDIDLREMRGFSPMRHLIQENGRSLPIVEGVVINNFAFGVGDVPGVDLDTHLCLVTGILSFECLWKRFESDETTTDFATGQEWESSRTGCLYSGKQTQFALRRPRNHTSADQNLLYLEHQFQKISHQNLYEIVRFNTQLVGVHEFRTFTKQKGLEPHRTAVSLFQGIHRACKATVESLRQKADEFERQHQDVFRLHEAIMGCFD